MPTIHSKSDPSSGSGVFIRYPRISGYTILDHLHEGSHSSIYMARQDRLGRIVAMKLVPEWPPPTDVALERFNRAAYVCAHTPHAGLATLYDVGTRDGYYYATYTHLEGQTLQRHLGTVGSVDETLAIKVGYQIARTMMALHANNICHRNVKPKNLFLENNGNLRMIGLGLASCKSAFFSPHLDAHAIGTPHFMAPEMIKGSCSDPRSDLYSLGVTLYVMVAGRPPYDRGIPAVVMSRHLTDTPASLKELRPELSSRFVSLVENLMVKDPARRVSSAAEAASMFEALNKKHSSFWKIAPILGAKPAMVPPPAAPAPVAPAAPAAKKSEPAPAAAPAVGKVASAKAVPPVAPQKVASPAPAPVPSTLRKAFRDPMFTALFAAISAVIFLLAAMFAASALFGHDTPKRVSPAPESVKQEQAWQAQPQVEIQLVPEDKAAPATAAPQEEFDRLLGLTANHIADPDSGVRAWNDFIQNHANLPESMKTTATQRINLLNHVLESRRRNAENATEQPRAREPEF